MDDPLPRINAERVLETCIYVNDLKTGEEFYSRVLGLIPFARVEGRHVFFRAGHGVFLVFNPEVTQHSHAGIPAHGARGPGHVAFEMREADIPAWRERLSENGIAIETEYTWPSGGFSIYFRDPAGNSVELVTAKAWGLEESRKPS